MTQRMLPKKSRLDQILLAILAGVFVFILVLLPFHAFISTWGGTAIGPLLVWKGWKEILIALLVPVVAWLCALRPDIARTIWARWYNKVILAYVVLTIAWAVFSPAHAEAVIAGLLMNLRFLAMFVIAQVILASGSLWVDTLKHRLALWIVAAGALVSVLAILQVTAMPKDFLTQFGYNKDTTISPYLLIDDNPNALRAFSTMRGPNTLAAYLLLPLAAALVLLWQNRARWWMAGSAALMATAIFVSHSRSGWLGTLVMLAALAFVTLPRAKLIKWVKFGTIPVLAVVAIVLWLATVIPSVRLVVFHSGGNDPSESLTEGSTDQHWQATLNGINHIIAAPLGEGVGMAGPASFYIPNGASIPENYFVQIGQEVGVLGLALFLAISLAVGYELWRRRSAGSWPQALIASFVGINVINIFLHGWADDPTAMTWWAIAGLALGAAPIKKVKSK